MVDKFLDSVLPTLFGAGGGFTGAVINPICAFPITLDEIIGTVISAIIFATIGGALGWLINKGLNSICKKGGK